MGVHLKCIWTAAILAFVHQLAAQEEAIVWREKAVQHGWVYSHARYPGFLADTIVTTGANYADEVVEFNFDEHAMKASHYYFTCPKQVKVDQQFEVVVGIPARDRAQGRIEWSSKYLNFPTKRHYTSGFRIEYFLVDSNVKHLYDRGVLRELQGVDFTGLPVRLLLSENGQPMVFENYDPRTNASIGMRMEWNEQMKVWLQIKSTELVRLDANVVYPDSVLVSEGYNRRQRSFYLQKPIKRFDAVQVYEDGMRYPLYPMDGAAAGKFILYLSESADSVVFQLNGMKQTIRIIPGQMNASFMGGVQMYRTNKPLITSGTSQTYYAWMHTKGRVTLEPSRFMKDGQVDSAALMSFTKRYAKELTSMGGLVFEYSVTTKQQAEELIHILKNDQDVGCIAPMLSDLGSPYTTYFFSSYQLQADPAISAEQWNQKLHELGLGKIITQGQSGLYTVQYSEKVLNQTYVNRLNALSRMPGVYSVSPNNYAVVEVDFD